MSSSTPEAISKCPVCKVGHLASSEKKELLGLLSRDYLECDNCGARFFKKPGGYELVKVGDNNNEIWQKYRNKTLSVGEWNRIAEGGLSDEEQKQKDMEYWMSELKKGNISFHIPGEVDIILKRGEHVIFSLPDIQLWEERAVRRTKGYYGGPSLKVAKGLYFRLGGFNAESEAHEKLTDIDRGELILTNKRLVFSGSMESLDIGLKKILQVKPYSDAFAISRESRKRVLYFVGINDAMLTLSISGRTYKEPMSGLIVMYMIEGLVSKL